MYKLARKISDLYGYICVDNCIYANRKGVEHLQELSLNGEVLWQSKEKEIGQYYVNEDVIIFNLYNDSEDQNFDDLFIYNRNTKKIIFKGRVELYLFAYQRYEGNILYDINENNIILFDISRGKVLEKKEVVTIGRTVVITEEYLIKLKKSYIYVYKKNDFSLFWQKDIRDFFNKEDSKDNQLRIQEVYVYKDNFVVVSSFGVLCLSQQDGSLLWKTNYYACTMEIVGQFGYVCTGLSLYRINLEDGETYNYGREYAQLPDFEYEGKTYWAAGNRVVYHEGLLWYLAYDSGDSFVIAINLENAEYQWIHKIDTYEKVDKIQFYQDKMFVSDSGGNLFIYEEMK